MIKMVLADFYAKRKEAFKNSFAHVVLLNLYLIMIFNFFQTRIGGEERFINTLQYLMLLFILLLHGMYPNHLNSAMFLTPVCREERKHYLYTAYGIKLVMTTGVHIICNGLLVVFGKMIWWQALLLVLVLLMFNMVVGMSNDGLSAPFLRINQSKEIYNGYRLWIFFIVSFFCFLILLGTDGKEITLGWELVLIIVLVIVEFLLCCWTIKKDFRVLMEQGLDYEKTMALVENGLYRNTKGGK